MKRYPTLFDAEAFPLFVHPGERMDALAAGEGQGARNHCTLDGKPARIIGRACPFATIEPIDLDTEPIRVRQQTAARIVDERQGAFTRADDE